MVNVDALYEVSWEITNKCGGIFTVISSKAKIMTKQYKEYYAVGPLFDKLPVEFTKEETPDHLQQTFTDLKSLGIKCVYGTWNIAGYPKTILVDGRSMYSQLNNIKQSLWEKYGVDTLNCSNDFNEPLIWSWSVGIMLESIKNQTPEKNIVAHFHEWLSGFGALYLKNQNSKIATVFTTHATMLGRSISQNGEVLKKVMNTFDPWEKAKQLGIIDKHSTENACANNVDVFTTVSDITAEECNAFFKRMPDVLPNGLDMENFPTFEQSSYNHIRLKRKLKEKLKSYFYPYQTFNMDDSLIFYFGGRYEFITKGLNVLPKALGKLNNYLKLSNLNKPIFCLFLVAMNSNGVKREILENESNFSDLNHSIDLFSDSMHDKITNSLMAGKEPENLLTKDEIKELKIFAYQLKKDGLPPLCSHTLPYDEISDPLLNELKSNGLLNRPEDLVKVIMVPDYIDGSDGFLDMPYYEVVNACHLGIFPSLYEPWGYTPLESIGYGVPAITTQEAGFGKFMSDKIPSSHQGIFLYPWQNNVADAADKIFEIMRNFISLNVHARVACKMNAHKLSYHADWKNLIVNYTNAHKKAIEQKTK